MAIFSTKKMQEIRKSKGFTYKNLSELTNISESSITKLFGGFNKNPTMNYLRKIAEALDCSIDDFFEWEALPTSPYHLDRITASILNDINKNPSIKKLLQLAQKMSSEDLHVITYIAEKITD